MRKSEVLEERRLVFGCVVVFWLGMVLELGMVLALGMWRLAHLEEKREVWWDEEKRLWPTK